MNKIKCQIIKSEKLCLTYSVNTRVNSVVRTLVALNGYDNLTKHAFFFLLSDEGKEFSTEDTFELYQSVKFAEVCSA